jgi:hypothetical protein
MPSGSGNCVNRPHPLGELLPLIRRWFDVAELLGECYEMLSAHGVSPVVGEREKHALRIAIGPMKSREKVKIEVTNNVCHLHPITMLGPIKAGESGSDKG